MSREERMDAAREEMSLIVPILMAAITPPLVVAHLLHQPLYLLLIFVLGPLAWLVIRPMYQRARRIMLDD